jgi:hypothetical protein
MSRKSPKEPPKQMSTLEIRKTDYVFCEQTQINTNAARASLPIYPQCQRAKTTPNPVRYLRPTLGIIRSSSAAERPWTPPYSQTYLTWQVKQAQKIAPPPNRASPRYQLGKALLSVHLLYSIRTLIQDVGSDAKCRLVRPTCCPNRDELVGQIISGTVPGREIKQCPKKPATL